MVKGRDYKIEWAFSVFRCVLFCLCLSFYWTHGMDGSFQLETISAYLLFAASILYIIFPLIALWKMTKGSEMAKRIVKFGAIFDILIFMSLFIATGGVSSPLVPAVSYMIMHVTLYWGTIGTVLSTLGVIVVLVYLFVMNVYESTATVSHLVFTTIFSLLVGILGGYIVTRERKHLREKLTAQKQINLDYLTRLYNQRFFRKTMQQIVQQERLCTLVMADVDYFKRINDQYGHLTGDLVLREIGKILARCVKKENGVVFRYGGEEFAFLFPHASQLCIKRVIEKIYKELSQRKFGREKLQVTMSFGIVTRKTAECENEWLERADQLLYKAKNMGRNCAVFEDESVYVNPIVKRIEKFGKKAKKTV